jgi:DHA2 family multidrug resistance protein-like MFS transporter
MATIMLGIALAVLDSSVVNLALPGMVRDLHSTASGAVWIVAGPVIAAAILSVASWPWLFLVNIPLGIVLIFLGRGVLPVNETRPLKDALSVLDVVLNAAMFVLLFLGADVLGASAREPAKAQAPIIWGAMLVAACFAIGWVHIARQPGRVRSRMGEPL